MKINSATKKPCRRGSTPPTMAAFGDHGLRAARRRDQLRGDEQSANALRHDATPKSGKGGVRGGGGGGGGRSGGGGRGGGGGGGGGWGGGGRAGDHAYALVRVELTGAEQGEAQPPDRKRATRAATALA